MENKYRISFTVGLGKTKNGERIKALAMKLDRARDCLAGFPGYTEIKHHGGWKDGGTLVEEIGVTWQVITLFEDYNPTAKFLRDLFEQSCVMVVKEPVEVEFV